MINFKFILKQKLICPHIKGTCPTENAMLMCEKLGRECPRKWNSKSG